VDRDRIERRDFPTGRRGYDPAAVDEHLRRVADEFEARAHTPAPSLAASTSDQVRQILEAAERGAAELRSAAGTEASGHVARVRESADGMLAKLDALESELTRLMTALRTSGERLAEGLADLQADAAAGLESGVDRTEHEQLRTREPSEPSRPATDAPAAPDPPAAADASPAPPGADASPAPAPPDEHDSPPLSAPDASDWPIPVGDTLFPEEAEPEPEDAGARLIALNMALNGSPRDDTRVFLEEHFDLPDVEALLDDVYARAGR
jgi:DivIVA domain-containing protein